MFLLPQPTDVKVDSVLYPLAPSIFVRLTLGESFQAHIHGYPNFGHYLSAYSRVKNMDILASMYETIVGTMWSCG